jgi:hypothetical protein
MKQLLARLASLREQIIPFASWEIAIMRLLYAWVVFGVIAHNDAHWLDTAPFPNGLAHWINFTFLAQPGVLLMLTWLAIPCLLFYVLGLFTTLSLTYLTWLVIAIGTISNSQGAIHHSTQIIGMTLLGQWIYALWATIADARAGCVSLLDDRERERRMVHVARVVIAAAYLTAAVTKLDATSGLWLWNTPSLAVQIIKTQANNYYDTLESPGEFLMERLPALVAVHPYLARIFFAPGFLLELFFPLALIGRRWSLGFGLGMMALHWGIAKVMGLTFEMHQWMLLIFFVNPAYWLVSGIGGAWRLFRSPRALAAAAGAQTVS